MTTPAHAPGPWHVGYFKKTVFDANRLIVAECDFASDKITETPFANAHLCAAAPELLEVCMQFVYALSACENEFDHSPGGYGELLSRARAVIDKAKGLS